jgi:microcystin-dependent protein
MSDQFIGEIRMFAGNFAPRGNHLCDGSLLSIAQYEALFTLLGTTYGGDGVTTFGLPDLRGRIPLHFGGTFVQGEMAGTESVTLTSLQIPAHTHPMQASNDIPTATSPEGNVPGQAAAKIYRAGTPNVSLNGASTSPSVVTIGGAPFGGSSLPHTNVQPFICLNFIICLEGIFPTRN